MRNIVITGASRGLGWALAQGLINPDDRAWLISRTEPAKLEGMRATWIGMDLSKPEAVNARAFQAIGGEPIHLLLHCAGIWESHSFGESSPGELLDVMNVNVTSIVLIVSLLERNLRDGGGNVVFIGSSWGLENAGTQRVASAASKFGLRGAAHALREHFRDAGVRVTCINPGWIGAADSPDGRPIPVADIVELVNCITRLSPATCVKEVVMTPTSDPDI